jgi:hypothetical protein
MFLGALAKWRKATLASSFLSLWLSIRMGQLGPHCTDFYEIWYLRFFLKICRQNSSFIEVKQE